MPAVEPQQAEEPPPAAPAPQIPPPPLDLDEEELWQAVGDIVLPSDDTVRLPEGCPKTSMHLQSYNVLHQAREEAIADKERKYSSGIARLRMEMEICRRGNGMVPRFYQEDCAEAFLLGVDTGLICATGLGKTEAFVLPLLADPTEKSKIVVVSTLNALQGDQAQRFNKYGITAAAVNGETYSDTLHKTCKAHLKCLQGSRERSHSSNPYFPRDDLQAPSLFSVDSLIGIVIDEVHCVLEWGKEFRRDFDDLEKTRSYMTRKPLFFCTATLTPGMLEQLLTKLAFPRCRRFLINLGNERHNITPVVCRMKGLRDFEALDFILDEALAEPPQPIVPTLIYADTREVVRSAWLYLVKKLPMDSPHRGEIEFLFSSRAEPVKTIVLAKFLRGIVKILVSTEAAGMGLDARVSRVVQFGTPRTLLELQQHAGRAGRDGNAAYSLLLVEPSVLQVVVRKKPRPVKGKGKAKSVAWKVKKEDTAPAPTPRRTLEEGRSIQNKNLPAVINVKEEPSEPVLSPQCKRKRLFEEIEDEDEPSPEDTPIPTLEDEPALDPSSQTDVGDQQVQYRKDVEQDMREYCMTEGCRRHITQRYFNSPASMQELTVPCCDNCLLKKGNSRENPLMLTDQESTIFNLIDRLDSRLVKGPKKTATVSLSGAMSSKSVPVSSTSVPLGSSSASLESSSVTLDSSPTESAVKIKRRTNERLKNIKTVLVALREEAWRKDYTGTMLMPVNLLPDDLLSTLASEAKVRTMNDIKQAVPSWIFAEELGPLALTRIEKADSAWLKVNDSVKKQRADARKAETARKKPAKDEEIQNGKKNLQKKGSSGGLTSQNRAPS
ncbi:P-loop containing nucleoside triphosphate hydrolase protein [Irpex rosettiformis]|uniref:P-loop containing nucleoside triphosphate hydrolase protein n=1 Tax=Irpex rosettiformis TaxID=378272 RepID=A0ACB8TV63_9APHY|nr:P-loop containing nucleoside triphosphate hydrolase protein [Irpex rosettiformis]